MGVYPEPALCADDARGLVSNVIQGASRDTETAACLGAARTVLSTVSGSPRRLLAALALGLSLAAPLPAAAHGNAARDIPAGLDLRLGDASQAWGEESLLDEDSAAQAITAAGRADLTRSAADFGEDVMRFGERNVPRPLVETILRAAAATGVDPVYMMALADKESSFDTDVKNPASSAQGLFQFVTGTWLEMIRDHGAAYGYAAEAAAIGKRAAVSDGAMRKRILALRNDPYVAGLMAGELIKRDRAKIESRIGRELKTSELYLAHFLGTASAGKFLSLKDENPEKVAASAFRSAARSNHSIFNGKENGKRRALTVAEVHERLDTMIETRIGKFEPVKVLTEPAAQTVELPQPTTDAPLLDARLRIQDPAIPAAE